MFDVIYVQCGITKEDFSDAGSSFKEQCLISFTCTHNWLESGMVLTIPVPWYYCPSSVFMLNLNFLGSVNVRIPFDISRRVRSGQWSQLFITCKESVILVIFP